MKKIVHLCLASFYIDNYSYQENLLPKYHKLMGYDVEIIASRLNYSNEGRVQYSTRTEKYVNEYGIIVKRLDYKTPERIFRVLRRYVGLEEALEEAKPDIFFIHGCQFADVSVVVKYLKEHVGITVFVDNHADSLNSARNWLSRNVKHAILWRYYAKMLENYTKRFFGVTPARVDFLTEMYHIDSSKVSLLVMGADDEAAKATATDATRRQVREQFGIKDFDLLLVTAGKIDSNKPEVLNLMQAVSEIKDNRIKLLVFGSVAPELKASFNRLIQNEKIIYGGWMAAKDNYKYFNSADLVVFPGLHSVYWEQAVGCGSACLFRKLPGFDHVDLGGNCRFFDTTDIKGIKGTIESLLADENCIREMRRISQEKGRREFAYSAIAKKSLEG